MEAIRLQRAVWYCDFTVPIGQTGGFGSVYRGKSATGASVAIKRLHLDAASSAHRELDLAEFLVDRNFRHVIPVLDAGYDANLGHYFVVMQLAEKSLRDHLSGSNGLHHREAIQILDDIVSGLLELQVVVHRDLKPENILLVEGGWRIADFGIARFTEAATSSKTLQRYFSELYSAPEQWNGETPTSKTDVYALGCIAYELLTGRPPFLKREDVTLRDQHLMSVPSLASITGAPILASLIGQMLRKPPAARPDLHRIAEQIHTAKAAEKLLERPGLARLRAAAARQNEEKIAAEAALKRSEFEHDRRTELAGSAFNSIVAIRAKLFQTICLELPDAEAHIYPQKVPNRARAQTLAIRMEGGELIFQIEGIYGLSGWNASTAILKSCGWECLAVAHVRVSRLGHRVIGTLLFTDAGKKETLRWHELSFGSKVFLDSDSFQTSTAALNQEELGDAIANQSFIYRILEGPKPIDDEAGDEFVDRWAGLYADALTGNLIAPLDPIETVKDAVHTKLPHK